MAGLMPDVWSKVIAERYYKRRHYIGNDLCIREFAGVVDYVIAGPFESLEAALAAMELMFGEQA